MVYRPQWSCLGGHGNQCLLRFYFIFAAWVYLRQVTLSNVYKTSGEEKVMGNVVLFLFPKRPGGFFFKKMATILNDSNIYFFVLVAL